MTQPSRITLRIEPRSQFRGYLLRKQRWACMVVHRRGGKTFVCIQDLLARALTHQRPGPPTRYAYIAPTRDQAKDIAWGYLKRFCASLAGSTVNEADLQITLPNKATIRLYSGDSYERMRGLYFDGVVIDEYGDIDPAAWHAVIRPCLTDYLGWATFIGTPKGPNQFFETWKLAASSEEWFSLMMRASESGIIPKEELDQIRADTPKHLYQQEYECDFSAPLPGAVYAQAIETARADGRICAMPIDGSNLVNTSWDLGSPQNTCVWYWQVVGREIRFIDCDRGFIGTLTERVAMMIRKGYSMGKHYLPHDAQQTERTGLTFATELSKTGLPGNVAVVPRTHSVWTGINHALELFPALSFRVPQCDSGLTALAAYQTREEGHGALSRNEPIGNWASHPADAFRMMAEAHLHGLVKFKFHTSESDARARDPYARERRKGLRPMRVA